MLFLFVSIFFSFFLGGFIPCKAFSVIPFYFVIIHFSFSSPFLFNPLFSISLLILSVFFLFLPTSMFRFPFFSLYILFRSCSSPSIITFFPAFSTCLHLTPTFYFPSPPSLPPSLLFSSFASGLTTIFSRSQRAARRPTFLPLTHFLFKLILA